MEEIARATGGSNAGEGGCRGRIRTVTGVGINSVRYLCSCRLWRDFWLETRQAALVHAQITNYL